MAYSGVSIVDYLKSVNKDPSFAARKKTAADLGITGYTGTAQQNTQMLNMLRNPKPVATPTQPAAPTPVQQAPSQQVPIVPVTEPATQKGAAMTALDNISPQRKQVNEVVQTLIDGYNTSFDPSSDASFQAAKGEIENQADRSYKNVMSGYLGNQGGNFDSAALQIAAGSQNDVLSQIPLLQGEYEDRFNANRRQNISDTNNLANILLGLEDRDIAASDKDMQRQIDTIGQYSKDYQAEINRRGAIDPNDALIPYLKIARAEKIANMNDAQLSAQEKSVKQAFDLWKVLGYATPEVAALLGIPQGTKTADYSDMLADNARANRSASGSGGKSDVTSGSDFGIALQTMMNSGNPTKWLEDNADVFSEDEYKGLHTYAKNEGLRQNDLFSNATVENKDAYNNIKNTFINDVNYKGNPQAALDRLYKTPMMEKLLGPLYAVLEQELKQMIDEQKEADKANKTQGTIDWVNP